MREIAKTQVCKACGTEFSSDRVEHDNYCPDCRPNMRGRSMKQFPGYEGLAYAVLHSAKSRYNKDREEVEEWMGSELFGVCCQLMEYDLEVARRVIREQRLFPWTPS